MIPDEQSRLRKAEHELYTNDMIPRQPRGILHDKKMEAAEDWVKPAEHQEFPNGGGESKHGSVFKKIFLGSVGILAVAVVIAAGSFFIGNGSISADKVEVQITTRAFVDGGESLPVDVTVTNRNRAPLELATLVLEYPAANADNADALARISRDIGALGVGDSHDESFAIQLYGEEGSIKNVTARVEFRVQGSNAVYDNADTELITVRTSPIRLVMDVPDKVLPNQEVPLEFTITGNGTALMSNIALRVEYPAGFTFSRADPQPSIGSNVWYLGDVAPGASRTITAYGSFSGSVNGEVSVRASVGSQSARNETQLDQIYGSAVSVIPLATAFLDAKIAVGNSTSATIPVSATQQVRVDVPWQNTTASRLTNVEIRVGISGSAYDPARVQPSSGFFDSVNNQVVWTRQQSSGLAAIDPGASGTVSFSITPKSFAPGSGVSNPNIVLTVSVRGVESGTVRTATNIDRKTLVIGSDLNLLSRTIHYSGPIQNTGIMPPKSNTETTYTLEWQITNSRNRITGVKVSTILPTNVEYKNIIVPQSENVSYNTVTRELVWNAGEVFAGGNRTLSIKVGITPSTSQIGGQAPLTDSIVITGRDTFTNTDITITKRGLDTRTLNDAAGAGAQGQVQ